MSRLAERQVEPFTVWDPVQLNEFGQAAVADLSDAERVLKSYVDSLEELRLYRRALRVQERHSSRLHQLGAIDERFMAEQPPTFDGVREVKLVERTLAPEPESVKRSPFRVEVSPDLERVDEMAVVRDNTLSWTNVTVTRTDASTYVKAFQGPVVTYRLMLDAAIDVNYVSFVSLVPCRLVNVHIWANGGKTTVDVDREIFGQEIIRFDPQDCAEVEIVVNQPNRVWDEDYLHIFGLTEWDVGESMHPTTWTWTSPQIPCDEDVYSVDLYAVERAVAVADALPNALQYTVNGERVTPRDHRVSELATAPGSDQRLYPAEVAADGSYLHLPMPMVVTETYRDGRGLGSSATQTGPQKVEPTGDWFHPTAEYYVNANLDGYPRSYRLFHLPRPLRVSVQFHSFLSNRTRPPILDELWLRIKHKRY
jgi:hypothetical protein